MNRIIAILILLLIVGYIAWKLFWFIADVRQENGITYKDATKKGFLWKEFFACIWKTVLVLFVVFGFVVAFYPEQNDTEEESEEYVAVEDDIDEYEGRSFSWEVDYDIPNGIMEPTEKSSCFSEIGYDSRNEALVVRFRNSGKAYVYLEFSSSDWSSFKTAKSLGSYYNKNIKGKYKSYRLVKE